MKNQFLKKGNVFIIILIVAFAVSCKKDNAGSTELSINSFTPARGAKDTIIVITGNAFSEDVAGNIVTINGVAAAVVHASSTQLEVKVPLLAGSGKISVKVGSKTVTAVNDFTYIYTFETLLGGTFGFADGEGSAAAFKNAYSLKTDAAGSIYVADGFNNRIRKIVPVTTRATAAATLAGDGTAGNTNGPIAIARFSNPRGIATDAAGNIYVADAGNNLIRKITPAGTVSTVAGNGNRGLVNGAAANAEFSFPTDLVVDAVGNIYVMDGNNSCVRKITPQGMVSTLGNAVFPYPQSVTVDADGNLYIADTDSHVIRKMTAAGVISIIAGSNRGYTDGAGNTATFSNPEGITIDAAGNLYVSDVGNAAIRKITQSVNGTVTVSTIAGGSRGAVDGLGGGAPFIEPSGIAMNAAGVIYISDLSNSRIRRVQ